MSSKTKSKTNKHRRILEPLTEQKQLLLTTDLRKTDSSFMAVSPMAGNLHESTGSKNGANRLNPLDDSTPGYKAQSSAMQDELCDCETPSFSQSASDG